MLHFNIYIGQSNYLKISSLGPPMVDPTPVSHSIAIIYFVARFFRLFPLYINGMVGEFLISIVLLPINHIFNLILCFPIIELLLASGFDELP